MTAPFVASADFAAFFEELHGVPPFPWQQRLAAQVTSAGRWPAALDLPTGTGKTAVLDVAVFAMACEAHLAPDERQAPRRVFLVVDRRTIVDQAHERACRLRDGLRRASATSVAGRVARGLAALAAGTQPGGPPLEVARLRGAVPRDDTWVRNPTMPLLGVSTVDQIGSRLLFRGYGVSPTMRSLHAGMLGNDALYFLDEVHLARPFAGTLEALRRCQRGCERELPRRLTVVEMSATRAPSPTPMDGHGATGGDVFSLDPSDHADPRLAERLTTSKPLDLPEPIKVSGDEPRRRVQLAKQLAAMASDAVDERHRRVAVVVNRVETARAVADELRALRPGDRRLLVTGRMRPLDRDPLERDLRELVGAGTRRAGADAPETPVFVVATQCIEAGADLDFDVMITECASLDALVQRFGRLDRLGQHRAARGVVAIRSDQVGDKADDPIYGRALTLTWEHLVRLRPAGVDVGLGGNLVPSERERAELMPPAREAPLLLPGYLDLWSQTAPEPGVEPELARWLHGAEDERAEVTLIWRADLAPDELGRLADGRAPDAPEQQALAARLVASPPSQLEAVSVPIGAARRWLRQQAVAAVSDLEGADHERRDERDERGEAVAARPFVVWRGASEPPRAHTELSALRPGATVVVPSVYGGLHEGTWAPDRGEPVTDLGDLAQLVHRRRVVVRLAAAVHGAEAAAGDPERAAWNARVATLAREARQTRNEEGARAADRVLWAGLGELVRSPERGPAGFARLALALAQQLADRPPRSRTIEPAGRAADDPDAHAEAPILTADLPRAARPTAPERAAPGRPEDAAGGAPVRVEDDADDESSTEDDGASLLGAAVSLPDHLAHVEAKARAFADAVGLPADVATTVILAAAWHDAGKADPRFQRWLVGGDEVSAAALLVPLAKSADTRWNARAQAFARERAGYPRGARHEVLSVALLEQAPAVLAQVPDVELFLHLVGSHHGWCRPLVPVEDAAPALDVVLEHGGVRLTASTDHGLAGLASGVADRFWRLTARYGWYGLAWLEAIVRLADHRASEDERARAGAGGAR